jgi:hypothetical protein
VTFAAAKATQAQPGGLGDPVYAVPSGRRLMQTPPIEYLFDPELVANRLRDLPGIAAILRDPYQEGVPSLAFPKRRKTRREIVRVIGRHNLYDHLDRLLNEFEELLDRGWTTHQLKASSLDEFGSLVSEVLVARHFAGQGLDLAPTVGQTITGVKPEFYVSDGTMTAGIEVFQPRDWQLIDAFIRKGTQLLVDADIPFDFGAGLELRLEHHFDENGQLVHPHPDLLEAGLAAAGSGFFEKLARELERLAPSALTLIVARADVNLEFEASIEMIEPSQGDEPARGVSHGWSVSAYVPEAIFHDILEKVRDKAGRRQAGQPGSQHARLLAVDLSTSPIKPHLYDTPRQTVYLDDVRDTLGSSVAAGDYDVIALCDPSFDEGLVPLFVCTNERETASTLLGPLPSVAVV